MLEPMFRITVREYSGREYYYVTNKSTNKVVADCWSNEANAQLTVDALNLQHYITRCNIRDAVDKKIKQIVEYNELKNNPGA